MRDTLIYLLGGIPKMHYPGYKRQYTGLTDKNGKKICEGDIYRTWSLNNELILQSKDGAETRRVVKYVVSDSGSGFVHLTRSKSMEVIGNIYENPELIS